MYAGTLPRLPARPSILDRVADLFFTPFNHQTNSALYGKPTFSTNAKNAWPSDSFNPGTPSATTVRSDRPRIIAPGYKWDALPNLIANEPYFSAWNDSIFANATDYYSLPPVKYNMDGASGILDNSREIKMRVKAFSYVYRMTKNTKWADRAWDEIQVRPRDFPK